MLQTFTGAGLGKLLSSMSCSTRAPKLKSSTYAGHRFTEPSKHNVLGKYEHRSSFANGKRTPCESDVQKEVGCRLYLVASDLHM
jgi:hypothetical protein